jgi:hypothetical protein
MQAKLKYLNKKGATYPDDIVSFANRKNKLI